MGHAWWKLSCDDFRIEHIANGFVDRGGRVSSVVVKVITRGMTLGGVLMKDRAAGAGIGGVVDAVFFG